MTENKQAMFPHTVTVYNITNIPDMTTLKDITVTSITILRGVFLSASKASNVRKSGLEGADAVNLIIPHDVDAVDGLTRDAKPFIGSVSYGNLQSEDDLRHFWTLADGGNTFFVKGEVVEPERDRQFIEAAYDDVYSVTKVDDKDYGGTMAHWEVGGK